MAGLGVTIFTDEHVSPLLARSLRERGYGAESCRDAHRVNQSISDDDQLRYAAQAGHALLTFNISDFVQLDNEWKVLGKDHAGIIVSSEIVNFSVLLARVCRHLDLIAPETQHNTLLWLL